jgi:hypothetical protein
MEEVGVHSLITMKIATIAIAASLAGCGMFVPQKDPLHENDVDQQGRSRQGKIESNIIANIRCEVSKGLYKAVATGEVPWLAEWGTAISLNLTWEDQSSINPNIIYTSPFGIAGANTFSLGAGVNGSAHATRNEAITFTLDNQILLQEAILQSRTQSGLNCRALESGATVESDLRIDEFIYDKATIAGGHEARTRKKQYPQFSTFQETLTFVLSLGGNVTPSWKFIRLSVNPSGPFVNATRTNTSQVIITLGPIVKPQGPAGPVALALEAQVQHQAAVLGTATATAIVSQTR